MHHFDGNGKLEHHDSLVPRFDQRNTTNSSLFVHPLLNCLFRAPTSAALK